MTETEIRAVFDYFLALCGACRARLGLSTTGPAMRPLPSACWACEQSEAAARLGGHVIPAREEK